MPRRQFYQFICNLCDPYSGGLLQSSDKGGKILGSVLLCSSEPTNAATFAQLVSSFCTDNENAAAVLRCDLQLVQFKEDPLGSLETYWYTGTNLVDNGGLFFTGSEV